MVLIHRWSSYTGGLKSRFDCTLNGSILGPGYHNVPSVEQAGQYTVHVDTCMAVERHVHFLWMYSGHDHRERGLLGWPN